MLLALCLLQLSVLTVANPFHKYPYVFLLDVGNEELEKVNTEQIRLSKQGGSLALRYPAIGNGEEIAHIRVSGIDFGTDLKANIVDGGPGYKYVVLVLMGNPGVNYDAIITIETVPSANDETSLQNVDNSSNIDCQESEKIDSNDSAEDLNDSAENENASQVSVKKNTELTQESSNVYSYAVNEALSGYGNNIHSNINDENEDSNENESEYNNDQKDIRIPSEDNQSDAEEPSEFENYIDDSDSPRLIENESEESHNNADYSTIIEDQNHAYNNDNQHLVKEGLYEQYDSFRENKYEEREIVPQSPQRFIPDDYGTSYIEDQADNDRAIDVEEIFEEEYENEENEQYSDNNNNNFIDSNDGSAVAY